MVRLGTPRSTPLAVQQWDSLIAINYPAREFGVTRMIPATEARRICPDIVLQHVATFREGQGGHWEYRDDAFQRINTDKVSLDPYRNESRKILNVIKKELSRWREGLGCYGDNDDVAMSESRVLQDAIVEKASVDEVFIDLSPLVFGVLRQRYPELRREMDGDHKAAALPPPPTTALEWNAEDYLVDLDESESEVDDPDWDDIAMLISSDIIRSLRMAIWETLSYTCSAGIARNKMMAKLGSSTHKPNKQTVVRNRAVQNFLGGFKFTKIRMLGGKLGDQIASHFGTDQVSDLLKVSLEQFRAILDDDTSSWLYGIVRGDDRSEVNPRTQFKSMLSAKSFRPSINSSDQAEKWLRIFAADIYNRLVKDGVLGNRRRPKTTTLHHRQGTQVRSRQISIPAAKQIDESLLFDLGMVLLRQVIGDGCAWPCANMSLSVGGFEDGVVNNRAIDGFLVRREQAKDISQQLQKESKLGMQQPVEKKRKLEDGNDGIKRFFTRDPETVGMQSGTQTTTTALQQTCKPDLAYERHDNNDNTPVPAGSTAESNRGSISVTFCDRCQKSVPAAEKIEHDDWHFAKDLVSHEREIIMTSSHRNSPSAQQAGRNGAKGRSKPEKGQMQLRFG